MKNKVISALLGLVVGIPMVLYAVSHRTVNTVPREALEIEKCIETVTETEIYTISSVPHTEPIAQAHIQTIAEEPETTTEPEFVPYNHIPLRPELQIAIKKECDKYNIAYDLILAVIFTESSFKWVNGDNGNAVGYMQIWPKYWQGVADMYELDLNTEYGNITCGIIILNSMLEANNGDLKKALTQYNTGNPDTVNSYADTVLANYKRVTLNADQSTVQPN